MMENLYRVIFTGTLRPGLTTQQIVDAFTTRFKVDETQARAIIQGGKRMQLKHNLTLAGAEQYLATLQEVGLQCVLEPQPPAAEPPPRPGLNPGVQPSGGAAAQPVEGSRPAGTDRPGAPLADPQGVAAGRGWGWIAEGWELFKVQPWTWIGAILIYLAITIALNLIPAVGGLMLSLIGPIFTGGLMIGANTQYQGGRFEVGHLFAGFSQRAGPLFLVALVYLGGMILTVVTITLIVGGFFALLSPGTLMGMEAGQPDLGQLNLAILIPGLLVLLLILPVMMAILFAPTLVALTDTPVLSAFRLSFLGCWRNLLPLFVFTLVAIVLIMATIITLGFGLLVVIPVLTIALYLAYRDIYT